MLDRAALQRALVGEDAGHPANSLQGKDAKVFAYYLSSVKPGGSGQQTIFRPPAMSGGLSTVSLAKDSSIYELAIRSANGKTIYELRMPFSELGASAAPWAQRLAALSAPLLLRMVERRAHQARNPRPDRVLAEAD